MKLKHKLIAQFFLLIILLCQSALGQGQPDGISVDEDGDGLIEIETLEELSAIRHQPDGSGYRASADANMITTGCPDTGCNGYELMRDLDFQDNASYSSISNKQDWTTGSGWLPITDFGGSDPSNITIFEGNGHTISNLYINRGSTQSVGLFGQINVATIRNLGLLAVAVTGLHRVGGLAGQNQGRLINVHVENGKVIGQGILGSVGLLVGWNSGGSSTIINGYVHGTITTEVNTGGVGGICGRNNGTISNSYAVVDISANIATGGLTGFNGGSISNSYARGSVSVMGAVRLDVGGLVGRLGTANSISNSYSTVNVRAAPDTPSVGGLVGRSQSDIPDVSNSYWDTITSGQMNSPGGGIGQTTEDLRMPTAASGIYMDWNRITNDWDFGTPNQYPVLKYSTQCSEGTSEDTSLPRCGTLLPGQGTGLRSLQILTENARLATDFDPTRTSYVVEVPTNTPSLTFEIAGYNDDTTAVIESSSGGGLPQISIGSSGISIEISLGSRTTIDIEVQDRFPSTRTSYTLNVRYADIVFQRGATAEGSANEGEIFTLALQASGDTGSETNNYEWTVVPENPSQLLNPNLVLSDLSLETLTVRVPPDFIARDRTTSTMVFSIRISGDVHISTTISLIISKRNNDTADRIRVIRSGGQYTYRVQFERADGSQYVDQDGGILDTYIQWQRRRSNAESWVNVGNGFSYTIPNEGDYQYRALAIYEDNQGYRQRFESAVINYLDIDDDNDGLIEIRYLEELEAIRYQPDGSGYKASASASRITTGCPVVGGVERCRGYELVRDLDFNNDESYRTADPAARTVIKNSWVVSNGNFTNASDSSWQPIALNAVFNGNGHTISNLQINRSVLNKNSIGLFSSIGASGRIENLGLVNPAIKGLSGIKNVGSFAGTMVLGGEIINSYVVGDVATGNTNRIIRGDVGASGQIGFIGGMVGWNKGLILNSYAKINVVAEDFGPPSGGQVRVGGLVGRNIDGGKVYNSYATGEVKGPCIVGGLVANQFSSDSTTIPTTSEIKNSYTTGNVETGFGACSNTNNRIAGGLVGANSNSTIENSYTLGAISGTGTLGGLIGRGSAPSDSYWNYNANDCGVQTRTVIDPNNPLGFTVINELFCFRNSDNPVMPGSDIRLPAGLQSATSPNFNANACLRTNGTIQSCMTYENWNTANWDFGTNMQYPAIKHGVGLDTDDPGCGTDTLPSCDLLLSGQRSDTLLLNSMSLSVNSQNVQLTPGFDANKFNYEATIEAETLPVVITVAATAAAGTAVAISRDGGSPLTKESDGTVDISADDSFNLTIETTIGNARKASYQIQVRLERSPQPNIFNVVYGDVPEGNIIDIVNVVNGGTPAELGQEAILSLNERDTIRLDASTTLAHNSPQLVYRWSQASGRSLLSGIQTTSTTIEFTVPTDFVARDQDEIMIILKIEAIESILATVSREVPLLVRKINNGNAESGVRWSVDNMLLADDLSSDIDGGPLTDISYQWLVEQSGTFVEIAGANQRIYTPPEDVRDAQYRLSISYTDGQGYQIPLSYDAPLFTVVRDFVDQDNDGLIEIETLEDLNAIRYQPDGSGYRADSTAQQISTGCPNDVCSGYELIRDLDFMDDESYSSTRNKVVWTTGVGWEPISLSAILEGNGYSISNLYINRGSTDFVGLFRSITVATIRNLGLSSIEVTGRNRVGGLADRNEGSLINVYVEDGKVTGQGFAGHVGLLVGRNWLSSSVIMNSYVHGTVTAENAADVGGICGINNGSISNSYAVVDVSANSLAGGITGSNSGSISNNYATGSVSLMGSGQQNAGGLVGLLMSAGSISNSYSTANVRADIDNNIGGLIGRSDSASPDVSSSYWDTITSGRMNSPGGGTGQTTEDLQMPKTASGIYMDWNRITNDWDFGAIDQYPVLKYSTQCSEDTSAITSLPQCGTLLPLQGTGLRDLNILTENARLATDFGSTTTSYIVEVPTNTTTLELQLAKYNDDATVTVESSDGQSMTLGSGDNQPTISISLGTIIDITIQDRFPSARTSYTLTVKYPDIVLQRGIVVEGSANEGETLTLSLPADAVGAGSGNSKNHAYRWEYQPSDQSQLLNPTLQLLDTISSTLTVRIPVDFVARDYDQSDVVFTVTVREADSMASTESIVTIIKQNNSDVAFDANLELNSDRSGTIADITAIATITSPDGDGDGEFRYAWQALALDDTQWRTVQTETTIKTISAYTVAEGAPPTTRYRLELSYTDVQGYTTTTQFGIYRPDVDIDDDGLIEIYYLEDLDAIRRSVNGRSYVPSSDIDMNSLGCDEDDAGTCSGYEIARHLDFGNDTHYQNLKNKATWTTGEGWSPIGSFATVLEGNGNIISGLYINRNQAGQGLFSSLTSSGSIRNLGLLGVNVRGGDNTGGFVRSLGGGSIINSYVRGNVSGGSETGGLASEGGGEMTNNYVNATISGSTYSGGLYGRDQATLLISDNYVRGSIRSLAGSGAILARLGGNGSVSNSYAANGRGNINGDGTITIINSYARGSSQQDELKQPTGPDHADPALYVGWGIQRWDYGTSEQFPILKYLEHCSNDPQTKRTEPPQCDTFLPDQDDGLRDLEIMSQDIVLDNNEVFASEVSNYMVSFYNNAPNLQLRLKAYDSDSQISVFRQGDSTDYFAGATADVSDPISLRNVQQTTVTIIVREVFPPTETEYTLVLVNRTLIVSEQIEVSGDVMFTGNEVSIDEGKTFTLALAQVRGGVGTINFPWSTGTDNSQLLNRNLVLSRTSPETLTVRIPPNFIARDRTNSTVIFSVRVSDDFVSITRLIRVTINKVDNDDSPQRNPRWGVDGASLTAVENIQDLDGNPSESDISYQWQRKPIVAVDWMDIDGATTETYTPPLEDTIAFNYRVGIRYTDAQNYMSDIAYSSPTLGDYRPDIDIDNDGLIEINYLEHLNAIRYQLDGTGYRTTPSANLITAGCGFGDSAVCRGYELIRDLDFSVDNSYSSVANKVIWQPNTTRSNAGWVPIGSNSLTAVSAPMIFEGNGYTISNLYQNTASYSGLFGNIENTTARQLIIYNTGLLDVDIRTQGGDNGGLVAACTNCLIAHSYVTGNLEALGSVDTMGGLVGRATADNTTDVDYRNIYARVDFVTGGSVTNLGNLLGRSDIHINNAYTRGDDQETYEGAMIGNFEGTLANSYGTGSEIAATGVFVNTNNYTTSNISILKSPTAPNTTIATDIYYEGWSEDSWDFGTSEQYPILKYSLARRDSYQACSNERRTKSTDQPQCDTFLPDQGIGLRDLIILEPGPTSQRIDSIFVSDKTQYTVWIRDDEENIQLELRGYDSEATIMIGGVGTAIGSTMTTIALPTDISLNIIATDSMPEPPIRLTLSKHLILSEPEKSRSNLSLPKMAL